MSSAILEAAKRLAQAAGEAQGEGDHRRAARLYMHAVLALTGVIPIAERCANSEQSASALPVARKTTDAA